MTVWVLINTRTLDVKVFSKKTRALFYLKTLAFVSGDSYKLVRKEVN